MSEKRRTFRVGREGSARSVALYSTQAGFWRTRDGASFMHHGHTWLGPEGRRYRIEKWSAPHTDRTFTSLQSALNDWARSTNEAEKKTARQLDTEIAEALVGSSTERESHATRAHARVRHLRVLTIRDGKGTKLAELTGGGSASRPGVRLWNAKQRKWQAVAHILTPGYYVDDRPANTADLKRYGFTLRPGEYLA
jgi:hypothetical protein